MALQTAENTHVFLKRSLKISKTGIQPALRWQAASNVIANSQLCASRQPAFCWQAASALMANSYRKNRWKGFDPATKWVRYFGAPLATWHKKDHLNGGRSCLDDDLFLRANGSPNGRDHQSCCPDANAHEESDGVEFC